MSAVLVARLRPAGRVALLATLLSALLATGLLVAGATIANAKSYAQVQVPAAAKAWPILRYGSKGAAVVYVQQRLDLKPTGFYNHQTVARVKVWERRARILPDGMISKTNWRALRVPHATGTSAVSGTVAAKRAAIIRWATAQVGKRYVVGGEGPSTFDCSGLLQYVVKNAIGRMLPRIATDQMNAMKPTSRPQPGDFVFVKNGSRSSHAAIYAGGGYWLEAANSRSPVRKAKAWTSSVRYRTLF